MFSFVFVYQVKLTLCWCVKPWLACLVGDSQEVGEVVDDAFKRGRVQIDEELTDLCSVARFYAKSSQFHVGVPNRGSPDSLPTHRRLVK